MVVECEFGISGDSGLRQLYVLYYGVLDPSTSEETRHETATRQLTDEIGELAKVENPEERKKRLEVLHDAAKEQMLTHLASTIVHDGIFPKFKSNEGKSPNEEFITLMTSSVENRGSQFLQVKRCIGCCRQGSCQWSCRGVDTEVLLMKSHERRRLVDTEASWDSIPQASPQRRLAAIPLCGKEACAPTLPQAEAGVSHSNLLPVIGVVSTLVCAAGCLVRRYLKQLKKSVQRDSFGFLPDSQRSSLNAAELMV